jgi:hypothetical protein
VAVGVQNSQSFGDMTWLTLPNTRANKSRRLRPLAAGPGSTTQQPLQASTVRKLYENFRAVLYVLVYRDFYWYTRFLPVYRATRDDYWWRLRSPHILFLYTVHCTCTVGDYAFCICILHFDFAFLNFAF